ncbi:MAG TPA: 3-dehydroquinate synthase [Dehalococcoidia bacterium]|nr:3-dehydroquinate synthase [Dehalococcoidia bacterium]
MKTDKQINNLVITGFSGTGKSLVAKEVARRLNWDFLDSDDEIVRRTGKPIAEIFRQDGEARFRELERGTIRQACQQRQTVIAMGGGAIVDSENYELLAQTGLIVCLEAKPETIYERLFREAACSPETEVRPLLAADNPLERIRQLKASRQPYYAKADWTIHTDGLSISEVAGEVIRAWRLLRRCAPRNDRKKAGNDMKKAGNDMKKAGNDSDKDIACVVETATQSYPIFVGYGLVDKLGEKMKQAALSGTATIISDDNVFSLYGSKVEKIVKGAGFAVNSFVVPPGEETKSMDHAVKIYDFLVEHRAERDDIIIALGGGVVGDLAGFVAATFLRGMFWVQVPTSLVAMGDASIGGKVGVNHPEGKNLIGAFYQPNLVLADPETLTTLPQRELTSGWAEVIKYGLILDKEFFEFLEGNVNRLAKLEPELLTRAIARSAAIKAQVVSQDEKEREGKRTILNYGHTIAHSLEAAAQYKRFLHGEAVAIGMEGAARLSQRLGLLPSSAVERQHALLQKFGLPTSLPAKRSNLKLSLAGITKAMELDKKVKGKAIRWVLLQDIGKTVIRSDVPQNEVLAVLRELAEL